jgi:C-terminal processing protease CtpA/Prc
MGGGGDHPAWAMAGRFYEKSTPLEAGSTIQPTGGWQFAGPVVMLQDEREASSAETFTWAMVETGRVVSVGRPTAGMTIIPTTFDAPSGIFSFRMGVHDRYTPIKRVQPEGIGTPPDVFVPYAPHLLTEGQDPCRRVGLEILRRLVDDEDRKSVVDAYAAVLESDAKRLPEKVRTDFDLLKTIGEHAAGLVAWEMLLEKAGHGHANRKARAEAVVEALGGRR